MKNVLIAGASGAIGRMLPADNHEFRTVFPEEAIKELLDYQQKHLTPEI